MKRPAKPPWHPLWSALLLAFAAACSLGCASVPLGRAAVDALAIKGASNVSPPEIEEKIATRTSPKFLGLFRGLFAYKVFDRYVFQRDLERVERFYRARGYYDAHVRAGRVQYSAADHVKLTVEVEEGPLTTVRRVQVNGVDTVPEEEADAVREAAAASVPVNEAFDEDEFATAEAAVARSLTDRGYAFVKVKRSATVDLPGHFADVVFNVEPDLPASYGEVKIVGLGSLPEGPVRRALDLEPGRLYSATELLDAQQALLDLGVFSSVVIEPDLPDPPPENRVVPITVRVESSRLRTLRLGGGLELDAIRTDLHAQFGWEDRNFLGGLRNFRVMVRPGLIFYPTRLPRLQTPTDLLPEVRLRAELRQPGLFEARTTGFVRGQTNVYPLLLSPKFVQGAPVFGYREVRGSVGLDRTWWKFYVSPFYNMQFNSPFAYIGDLPPALTRFLISYMELLAVFDFRDDRMQPHKGFYFSNDLQVAGGPFFGDASDLRIQPEARAYVPVTRRVTLATRASIGFLFPYNYGDTLTAPRSVYLTDPQAERDIQLAYFRGFFSGGPNSNRGYPLRGVGPHSIVPFACSGGAVLDPLQCVVPLGGLSLWEASVEVRFPVLGPLSGAVFMDASDVSRSRLTLRINYPHLSTGLGVRYDTPVGPVRLDIGYRIPGMQVLGVAHPSDQVDPGTTFGAPVAVNLAIGEAF